jgi:ribosomal protein S12 methylthiotransferase accessory factor
MILFDEVKADPSLEQILRLIVHHRHGIITKIIEECNISDLDGLFLINAGCVNLKSVLLSQTKIETLANDPESLRGGGAGFDKNSALWSMCGEVIERYCAADCSEDICIIAKASALGDKIFPIKTYISFLESQYASNNFPFSPFEENVLQKWVKGYDLTRETQEVIIPAHLVYLNSSAPSVDGIWFQSTSTGLACHSNLGHGVISALCEVIERDSFAAMWQMRYQPKLIEITEHDKNKLSPKVLSYLSQSHLNISLFDISTDLVVPVVLCVIRSQTDGYVAFGASCCLDIFSAINKALIESLSGLGLIYNFLKSDRSIQHCSEIKSAIDHARYYLDKDNHHALDFLFEKEETIATDHPSLNQLHSGKDLINRIADRGYSALVCDVTSEDVKNIGLQVVRGVIPGLQPLLFGNLISLDTRRLEKVADYWGFTTVPETNPHPHPFP